MKKTILLSIVALAGVGISAGYYFYLQQDDLNLPPANSSVSVQLDKARKILLPNQLNTTGNLSALQTARISAKVGGYITHINYQEGQDVKAGTVLVQLDDRQEKNALASAKADTKLSELQFERDKNLLKKGLILQQTYYQDKVTTAKNQATVLNDQTQLSYKTIRAPFNGTVGAKTLSVGDYVNAGNAIVMLVDAKHLKVIYALPSHYLKALAIGQVVKVTDNQNSQNPILGKVSYIAPTVDPNSQTIEVHAQINNENNRLKPGEFVQIRQVLGEPKPMVVVPTPSVFNTINGDYVFGIKDNKAIKIPVTIGQHLKRDQTVILSGLKPGDEIVVAGQDHLTPGQTVKVMSKSKES